jgi:hypothetical protein
MAYTVRLHFKVNGTRRTLKTFIRPEYAINTSSHADRFPTLDAAETAADDLVEQMSASGRVTFTHADFFMVEA